MRSTSALYRYACVEEGCVSHSELVKLFHGMDVAFDSEAGAANHADETMRAPPPPALTEKMLLAYTPSLCFPTHLTLSKSYLGDAGLAALMRMLPMLRWVRAIEARGVGAGPRAIDALSDALTAYLIEGCEEAATLSTGTATTRLVSKTEPLAGGRLPALELVDLRDNDAIYSLSGQRLLSALRRRRLMLRAWCTENRVVGDVVPALEVHIDLHALSPSIASALRKWNEAAANTKYQRFLAREAHRWQEQLQVFTVRSAASEGIKYTDNSMPGGVSDAAETQQPVGEHVIFRLPASTDDDSPAEQLTHEVNASMDDFLTASCCFSWTKKEPRQPPHENESYLPSPLPTPESVCAALQLCVDFGADALAILPHTNAALWYVAGVCQQQRNMEPHASADPMNVAKTDDVQLNHWEAKANVAALLRGLQANPALEMELQTSAFVGGIVIQRHLYRLRELYVQLDRSDAQPASTMCTGRVEGAEGTPLSEMVALYYRIVAALVGRRFSDTHLPSMQACEQHILDVTEHVLHHLVVGEEFSEALEARIERLRKRLDCPDDILGGPDAQPPSTDSCSSDVRILPPVMSQCLYHLRRHQAAAGAWAKTYAGAPPTNPPLTSSAELTAPGSLLDAYHCCHCAKAFRCHMEKHATPTPSSQWMPPSLPQPCNSCSYHALQAAQKLLQRVEKGTPEGSELCARWSLLAPVRRALPRELRMFFLDMTIRQRSRLRGGCAYLPSLDSVKSVSAPFPESMVGWLAYNEGQREIWVKLLRLFGEWYRLRALESYGIAEARALLRQPPT